MNATIPITEKIYWIGVNDHETDLFESIWPLPRGISYNSYLILDKKNVLIDTVKAAYFNLYLDKIKHLLQGGRTVDYLVVNHMEPDHSGSIKVLRDLFPAMKIIGNKKTMEFLKDFYEVEDRLHIVADGEELDLGDQTLKFFLTPMVHWPETMMTYEVTNKILFTCDAFGGFGALDDGIFDDEVDFAYYEDEILRYFSNIVGRYSNMVQKALAKLADVDIKVIAPSHGPIWRRNPSHIIKHYDRWSRHDTEKGVVLVYASMYGNTRKMAEAVSRSMAEQGIKKIRVHDISRSHVSFIIRDAWRFKALVLGSPTYNTRLFPPMDHLLCFLKSELMKNHVLGIFGTYSWSKGAVDDLRQFAETPGWTLVEPVIEAKSSPTDEDIRNCILLGKNIVKSLGDK